MMNTQNTDTAAETLLDAAHELRSAANSARAAGHLDALDSTFSALATIERAQSELVAALRARGITWQTIGDRFGTSRQAAWERFS